LTIIFAEGIGRQNERAIEKQLYLHRELTQTNRGFGRTIGRKIKFAEGTERTKQMDLQEQKSKCRVPEYVEQVCEEQI